MKVCLLLALLSLAPQDNKPIKPNLAKGQGLYKKHVRAHACGCEHGKLKKSANRYAAKKSLISPLLEIQIKPIMQGDDISSE